MNRSVNGLGRSSGDSQTLSRAATVEILRNQRRRFALHHLKHVDGPVSVSELTERVGGWENERPGEELTREQRNRVRTALQQFHLPKMAEYGFLEYDRESERVSLTPAAAETEFYVDSLSGREIPWGVYYLGLSILMVAGLLAVWGDLGPFAAVSIVVYSVFAATVLAVSSLGHCYDTYYRMRLGTGEEPPRVNDK